MGCAEDPIGEGDENVEDPDYLDYGELLPGPDYQAVGDATYDQTVIEEGGPITPADWAALDEFEAAMDEAANTAYLSLPTFVAEEFPGLTEAERNQMISDFQAAVATGFLMRDDPYSPECVEIYAENELTGELEWQPICDGELGPEFRGRVLKLVREVGARAWQGRHQLKAAAVNVGNWATRQAGNVRRVAGQVVQHVKNGATAAAMRAGQLAAAARMYAAQGWNAVKQKYAQAKWWQKAVVQFAAWEGGFWAAENVIGWVSNQLFGGTETAEEDAVQELLRRSAEDTTGIDVLFDM
jgi:hypothetical protein